LRNPDFSRCSTDLREEGDGGCSLLSKFARSKFGRVAVLVTSIMVGTNSIGCNKGEKSPDGVSVEKCQVDDLHDFQVPGVTDERIDTAKVDLVAAYEIISKMPVPTDERGEEILNEFRGKQFDPNDYLPLEIKESKLDNSAESRSGAKGYFQIRDIAAQEVERVFGYKGNSSDPVSNSVMGILYLELCKNFANDAVYGSLSDEDRGFLSYAIYNAGPGNMKNLWEILEPNSYPDFEAKLSKYVCSSLGGNCGSEGSTTLNDVNYGVTYSATPAVAEYFDPNRPWKHDGNAIFVDKKKAQITAAKAIELTRYVRVIEGIDKALDAEQKFSEMNCINDVPVENYVVKSGETLWSIGRKFGVSVGYLQTINGLKSDAISVDQTLVVPSGILRQAAEPYLYSGLTGEPWITVTPGKGFYSTIVKNEQYNNYLEQVIKIDEKSEIVDVVMAFNQRFNPELKDLKDDASIPIGAQILVPNAKFFIDYYRGVFDREAESGVDTKKPVNDVVSSSAVLNKTSVGQYVGKNASGEWVNDIALSAVGAEKFATVEFEAHPKWNADSLVAKRQLMGGKVGLDDVDYIILHSTASDSVFSVIGPSGPKAHFGVDKDGSIYYFVHVDKGTPSKDKIAPHAGKSKWNGVDDLNTNSIGIEVVAENGEDWTPAQYEAVKQLVAWLGGYYGLCKNDVLMHKQVAVGKFGRGRKRDPYTTVYASFFSNLGLPDNSRLLDLDVAYDRVDANISSVGKENTVWSGLSGADEMR